MEEARSFNQLVEVSKNILAESDVGRTLDISVDQLIKMTNAERGLILLFDEKDDITFEAARKLSKEDIKNPKFEILFYICVFQVSALTCNCVNKSFVNGPLSVIRC